MSKINLRKTLSFLLFFTLILVLAAPIQAAPSKKKYETGMLTSPPPNGDFVSRYVPGSTNSSKGPKTSGITAQSAWNSNHMYLSSGVAQIGFSDSKIRINGSTNATMSVQRIGIGLKLQRWTGSYWVDVYTSSEKVLSDTSTTSKSDETSAIKGYYYRTVSTHWIEHNGISETGTTYGTSKPFM